jgi:hypothetical protein
MSGTQQTLLGENMDIDFAVMMRKQKLTILECIQRYVRMDGGITGVW